VYEYSVYELSTGMYVLLGVRSYIKLLMKLSCILQYHRPKLPILRIPTARDRDCFRAKAHKETYGPEASIALADEEKMHKV